MELAALAVQPPQQPDLLGQYGKMMQLRNLGQQGQIQQQQIQAQTMENQQRQMDLQDQQKFRQAFIDNNGDPQKTYDAAAKSGVSPKLLIPFKQQTQALTMQTMEMGEKAIAFQRTQNDLIQGAHDEVAAAPPEARPQVYAQQLQGLQKAGVDVSKLPPQYPGDAALPMLGATLNSHKQILDDAAKQAETLKNTQQGLEAQESTAEKKTLFPSAMEKSQAEATTAQVTAQNAPLNQKLEQAQKRASTAEATASTGKTNIETQMLKNAPAGLQGVQPHLIAPAAAAYDKTGQEYAAAKQASDNLTDFLDMAKSGNKAAVKIVPLQGALEITTAQGVHRINRTEVDQYGGAGSAYDKLAGGVNGLLTGKNITDSVLNDMAALQQTIDKNAKTLHSRKVDTINTTYGSHFKPMDFSGADSSKAISQPSAATMKVPGSDGKMHWSDGKRDLGLAE